MNVLTAIREVQGDALFSSFAQQQVQVQGVVTGILRRGFYIQTPKVVWDGQCSDAIFIYGAGEGIKLGSLVQVAGECVNFIKHDAARPMTQIKLNTLEVVQEQGPEISPMRLSQALLPLDREALAAKLNSLEGMLLAIPAHAMFIAPSNLFGDYVCALPHHFSEACVIKTQEGGLILTEGSGGRWFPGFRLRDYRDAPALNVGSELLSDVIGPLHYRVDAWQISAQQGFKHSDKTIALQKSRIHSSDGQLSILTLNCFNLDWHIEAPERVANPGRDVDDDWGDGRFHSLAHAVVEQANTPDIVALQEIQDNDGAELTDVVQASKTYMALILIIKQLSGVEYQWVDIAPKAGADGGQPGGNIRNGYLYNPTRVECVPGSVQLIGASDPCFIDSRKPLAATFKERVKGNEITVVNVHLVSKREQLSIFAPVNAGVDFREGLRIQQAQAIYRHTQQLLNQGKSYYITGDFNDHEHSNTLNALVGESNANLVLTLPPETRFDYNHRGKLQVLMHGVLPKKFVESNKVDYEIIHGNELIGAEPGANSDKPSDHAYVLAKIDLS